MADDTAQTETPAKTKGKTADLLEQAAAQPATAAEADTGRKKVLVTVAKGRSLQHSDDPWVTDVNGQRTFRGRYEPKTYGPGEQVAVYTDEVDDLAARGFIVTPENPNAKFAPIPAAGSDTAA